MKTPKLCHQEDNTQHPNIGALAIQNSTPEGRKGSSSLV